MARAATPDLDAVFTRLRGLMIPHAGGLDVVRDEPGDLYLNTRHRRADGYVFMFGAVKVNARYVSYHLFPVYASPELRDAVSPALARRMQGKGCFNFTRVDEELLAELGHLTARGAELARDPALYGV